MTRGLSTATCSSFSQLFVASKGILKSTCVQERQIVLSISLIKTSVAVS